MIDSDKSTLRAFYKSIRASVMDRDSKNKLIAESVLKSPEYKNADKIFAYWSVGTEVDTLEIIENALSCGKKVALPKCTDADGYMQFNYIHSLSDLTEGMYGIAEPSVKFPADDYTPESLCLVPALSFDKCGYRLGYGKGYYDRFLCNFTGISIGLAYEELLCDMLPRNIYDKKVNYIVTDFKKYDMR